jgi:hypothetical protein
MTNLPSAATTTVWLLLSLFLLLVEHYDESLIGRGACGPAPLAVDRSGRDRSRSMDTRSSRSDRNWMLG